MKHICFYFDCLRTRGRNAFLISKALVNPENCCPYLHQHCPTIKPRTIPQVLRKRAAPSKKNGRIRLLALNEGEETANPGGRLSAAKNAAPRASPVHLRVPPQQSLVRISGPPGLLCEPRLGSAAVSPEVLASAGVTEDRHTVLAGSAPDHCQAAPGSRPSGAVTRNLPQWLLRPGLPGIPTGSCLASAPGRAVAGGCPGLQAATVTVTFGPCGQRRLSRWQNGLPLLATVSKLEHHDWDFNAGQGPGPGTIASLDWQREGR